jgi:hypothetical protein
LFEKRTANGRDGIVHGLTRCVDHQSFTIPRLIVLDDLFRPGQRFSLTPCRSARKPAQMFVSV